MTGFYEDLAATAASMIAEFGGPCTVNAAGAPVYNPDTGTATSSNASRPANGVLLDFGAGQTAARGTLIQVGDKRLLLDASAAPDMNDRITAPDGVNYGIISIGDIAPDGATHVLWDLHLRR